MINVVIPDTVLTNRNNDNHLAFVTYRNKNGEIVNKTRLNSYCEEGTGVIDEYDNVPVSGIKVVSFTDSKRDNGVYLRDPRGFIVKVPAYVLSDMLSISSYEPDSGFTAEFVFGSDGINLIYVSVDSVEYKTGLMLYNSTLVSYAELIPGRHYVFWGNNPRLYLGKHPVLNVDRFDSYFGPTHTSTLSDTSNIIYKDERYEYTVDDAYIFLTKNNTYKVLYESDIRDLELMEFPDDSPVPQSRLTTIMEHFYRETTRSRPDHFGTITSMVPRLSSEMFECNPDTKTGISGFECYWLFGEDYRSVAVYEPHGEKYVYVKDVYEIDGNVLVRNIVHRNAGTRCNMMSISDLVRDYAHTGRLYVSDMEFPLQDRCLDLVTDNGYVFSPYTNLMYVFIKFKDNE